MITCLFLGLPRNLTTLTAAVLSLHPNVQVMNHGFRRIEKTDALRAFHDPTSSNVSELIDLLLELSIGGKRGGFGGSILLSHAFRKPEMQAAYRQRFGEAEFKHDVHVMAWKDS